jgi:hypothetical protein
MSIRNRIEAVKAKDRGSVNVDHQVFDSMKVGKVYRFNGRKGKVVEKQSPNQKNARGRYVGMPVVIVDWLE